MVAGMQYVVDLGSVIYFMGRVRLGWVLKHQFTSVLLDVIFFSLNKPSSDG